jgi:hypothetical protein
MVTKVPYKMPGIDKYHKTLEARRPVCALNFIGLLT